MGHRLRRAEKMVAAYHFAATPEKPPSGAKNRCYITLDLM